MSRVSFLEASFSAAISACSLGPVFLIASSREGCVVKAERLYAVVVCLGLSVIDTIKSKR